MSGLNKRNILIGLVLFGVAFVVVGAASVITWEYSNSNEFCGNACHAVHPQEPFAHELSVHANVQCVECHIGRMGFFESALVKSGHVTHAWSLLVGYERPTVSHSLQSANSCEKCHPSDTHRKNPIRMISHFAEDRDNTESQTLLIMRLTGRDLVADERLGLNWHASGTVRYRTDDPQRQHINWVEARLPDGTVKVYEHVTNGDEESEKTDAEIQTMDCSTCHNRVGHPFPNPERALDEALASGLLSPELPYMKKTMRELLLREIETEREARTQVREAVDGYMSAYPDAATEDIPDVRQYLLAREDDLVALKVAREHLEDANINWQSFPDNTGHLDGPGCFRCHNGSLQTAEGVPVPVNCTTCHSVPLVTEDGKLPAYYTAMLDMAAPEDHRDPAFMANHADLFDDSCEDCHGELDFGDDNLSHCANSACHGTDWQYLDFEALW